MLIKSNQVRSIRDVSCGKLDKGMRSYFVMSYMGKGVNRMVEHKNHVNEIVYIIIDFGVNVHEERLVDVPLLIRDVCESQVSYMKGVILHGFLEVTRMDNRCYGTL